MLGRKIYTSPRNCQPTHGVQRLLPRLPVQSPGFIMKRRICWVHRGIRLEGGKVQSRKFEASKKGCRNLRSCDATPAGSTFDHRLDAREPGPAATTTIFIRLERSYNTTVHARARQQVLQSSKLQLSACLPSTLPRSPLDSEGTVMRPRSCPHYEAGNTQYSD